jgi:GNAT superfamily N-acetyltransferase
LKLEIRAFEINDLSNTWELTNLFRRKPITHQRQIELENETRLEDVIRERATAVFNKEIVGFSSLCKQQFMGKISYFAQIAVLTEVRGQGIGTKLLNQLLENARTWNVPKLRCEVSNLGSRDLRFLEDHNIKIRERVVLSQLDLTDFDEAKFQVLESQALSQSIQFVRLADCPDDAETRKNLYQLVRQSVEDDPGFEGEFETPEQFNERIWNIYWDAREHWVLAVDGLRFVAMAGTSPINPELWHTNLTGVARAYRKRGLAQIVKAKSIRIARDAGAKFMNTGNDSTNAPMIAVNRKLGFKQLGDRYWLELILV